MIKYGKTLLTSLLLTLCLFASYAGISAPAAQASMVIDQYRVAASGMVNSVQNVTITIASGASNGSSTLGTAINTTFASIAFNGEVDASGTTWNGQDDEARVSITDGTHVRADRTSTAAFALTVYVTVTDWNSAKVKSVQCGTSTVALSATTQSTAITSVVTGNSAVIFDGYTVSASDTSIQTGDTDVQLLDATHVQAHRDTLSASFTTTAGWCVVEWNSGVLNSSTQQFVNSFTATSATSSPSSVTTGQTALFWGGCTNTSAGVTHGGSVMAVLTNGTTVTFTKVVGTFTTEGVVTVVEFKAADIQSVNRTSNVIAANTASKSFAITAVNTAKTMANQIGFNITTSSNGADFYTGTTLASSTSETSTRSSSVASPNPTASVEAIEFK